MRRPFRSSSHYLKMYRETSSVAGYWLSSLEFNRLDGCCRKTIHDRFGGWLKFTSIAKQDPIKWPKLLEKAKVAEESGPYVDKELMAISPVIERYYVEHEFGLLALSKLANLSQTCIRNMLLRAGITLRKPSPRNPDKLLKNGRRYDSNGKSLEFSALTRRKAFEAQSGKCAWCKHQITEGFRFACYHHKLPVNLGGNGSVENCEVYHSNCHYDPVVFRAIHGFTLGSRYSNNREVNIHAVREKFNAEINLARILGGHAH
jgi:hypothetical protein